LRGTQHTVEVTARSLYEAVAQAFALMKKEQWVGEIGRGLTTITVQVLAPTVEHTIKVADFERWLEKPGRTPAEIIEKKRLRELLDS
jgi:hypothetical protein